MGVKTPLTEIGNLPTWEDKLRIGMLINLAPVKLGGAERWMLELAREALARGHEIHFATHNPASEEWAQGIRGLGATWGTLESLGSSVVGIRKAIEGRFDVVQLNLLGPRSRYALAAYLAPHASVVFVDHVSDKGTDERISRVRKWVLRCTDRATIEFIDLYIGVSKYVTQRSMNRFGGKEDRYRTVYNGVDVERYAPRQRAKGTVQITTVAHLIREKGVAVLLEACASLNCREFRLNIVGEGPQRAELESLARERGIADRVRFLGLRDDVDKILGRTHIFVHPATWNEAYGYTVAEAMSAGCAVVASNVGALPELLAESSGILVSPGSSSAIRSALIHLLNYPDRRKQLGSLARARARKKFDVRDCASNHVGACELATKLP